MVATITQIANIYWDLVSAYEEEKVNEQSFAFAQQSLDNAQKQLQLEADSGDGRDARGGRSLAPRPGPDRREDQSCSCRNR